MKTNFWIIDWLCEWVIWLLPNLCLESRYPIIRVLSLPAAVLWMPISFIGLPILLVLGLVEMCVEAWNGEL
jgi:hypothetical protein